MKVLVTMIIDTPDFEEIIFREEINKLISEIDIDSDLIEFEMFEIDRTTILEDMRLKRAWEI